MTPSELSSWLKNSHAIDFLKEVEFFSMEQVSSFTSERSGAEIVNLGKNPHALRHGLESVKDRLRLSRHFALASNSAVLLGFGAFEHSIGDLCLNAKLIKPKERHPCPGFSRITKELRSGQNVTIVSDSKEWDDATNWQRVRDRIAHRGSVFNLAAPCKNQANCDCDKCCLERLSYSFVPMQDGLEWGYVAFPQVEITRMFACFTQIIENMVAELTIEAKK